MNDQESNNGFRRVIRDCIDLAELQFQLLSIDSQEARRKASTAIALGGVSVTLGGSMLTVALMGLGFFLHEQTELSTGVSLLTVCGVTFLVVVLLGWFALRLVRSAASALAETKSELAENLRWIKATILEPETSARYQLRAESFPDLPGMNDVENEHSVSSYRPHLTRR